MHKKLTKSILLLCGLCFTAFGQTERGSIRGTIFDPSGAAVPGVTVSAISPATGIKTSTVTTGAGNYNIPQLPPGNYTVQAEGTGFKKTVRENVVVEVSGVTALDFNMEVGQVNEQVTVTAAAPMLQSETSDISINVNPKSYNDLPLTSAAGFVGGRGPEAFIFLSPGITPGVHA
ncbi:MAG TPA: carboxypeptidase-like regulatory domain-containing protein, partial [Bryobacteraceae bacterium]